MTTNTLLVELGTEELPPKSLRNLATAFKDNFVAKLNKAELTFSNVQWYATPRRLALKVFDLIDKQPDKKIQKKGPSIEVAYKDGEPTKVALGWAKSNNIDLSEASTLKTDKGEWLVYETLQKGAKLQDLIPDFIAKSLAELPIPKLMHWGSSKALFVRPAHTLTILYGNQLIDAQILGLKSSKTIRGHRFMGMQEFEINDANEYPEILEDKGSVIADYDRRKSMIIDMIKTQAQALNGEADMDDSLIEEVTSLVEYPSILTAKFEEKFLAVPSEALVHTMKGDQKYFPVYKDGKLLPNFIFISNIKSPNPEFVIAGNERVVRPRLSDAEFFFNTDRKQSLESHFASLSNVIFQKQLGTLADKSKNVANIAQIIAQTIGANVEHAKTASLLSKCDLMTNMVNEFPDTQGIMGMHYARLEGYPEDVALAINEQYMPRFAGDNLPSTPVSCAVTLAEKITTLVGIFGINQIPKGDKDPFGLRRASIGVIRIIIENNLDLDLAPLIEESIKCYENKLTNPNTKKDVLDYVMARFKAYYQEKGITGDIVASVLATNVTNLTDFNKRVLAVNSFKTLPEAENLAAANKRVANILAKSEHSTTFNENTLCQEEEINLFKSLQNVQSNFYDLVAKHDYALALKSLAVLKDPIDLFFDKVIVNADDNNLKKNRLALLAILRNLFIQIADISLLSK